MKTLFIFLYMIMVSEASSGVDIKEYSSDLNNDGKVDYVEIYKDKILVERKEDLNFDGTFDRQTLFSPDTDEEYFKVVTEKKYDNEPSKMITYWNDERIKKTLSLTQIDENNDGIWDKEFTTGSNINSDKDNCSRPGPVSELAKTSVKAAEMCDEYVDTSWGHKVHKSCLANGAKDWFLSNSERAIKEGLACLQNLGSKGGKGAAKNYASLSNILAQKNVRIVCNETSYEWSRALAHATTSSDPQSFLKHPSISFNPVGFKGYMKGNEGGTNEFIRTMFHEQLHNLGYKHDHDIEYQYTCEKCCFPEKTDTAEAVESACKVCSGNFKGTLDLAYIRDISAYGAAYFSRSQAISATQSFIKANPRNTTGMAYLALNLSGFFDPVGPQLAEKIRLTQKNVSASDAEILAKAESFKNSKLHNAYKKTSKVLAEAYYDTYVSNDPVSAIRRIKREAAAIKKEIAQKHPEPSAVYAVESLNQSIKRIVFDIWLYKNHGNLKDQAAKKNLNDEAFELTAIFNL